MIASNTRILIATSLLVVFAPLGRTQEQPIELSWPNGLRIAQNGGPTPPPPSRPRLGGSGDDIESLLERLKSTAGRVSQQIQVPPAPDTTPALPEPQPFYTPPAASSTLPTTENPLAKENVSKIREQIQTLRRLRMMKETTPPEAAPSEPALSPLPSVVESPTPPDPNITAIEQSLDATPGTSEPADAAVTPIDVEATEVLSGPVNSLALGQSLYRTKNYEAALKAFNNVDVANMEPADRSWLELMKAMCHRRLDKTADSEAILRTLANDKSGDYPVSAAQWWLKHSEAVSDSRPFFDQTSASIDSLLERAKKHVQPNP